MEVAALAQRTHFIDEAGFEHGAKARVDLHAELPSMRAVGYRQAWSALDANDLSSLAATGSAATRQFAKRQLTWLRAMPARQVVAADAPDAVEQVVRVARRLLAL